MALAIRSIPVLQGKLAEEFVKKTDEAFRNKQREELKQRQLTSLNNILKKANMK